MTVQAVQKVRETWEQRRADVVAEMRTQQAIRDEHARVGGSLTAYRLALWQVQYMQGQLDMLDAMLPPFIEAAAR